MKKNDTNKPSPILWIIPLLLIILTIGVIPINLFFLHLPEWISIVMSCSCLASGVAMWLRLKGKYVGKTILSLLGVIAIALSLFGSYCNPYWNSVSFQSDVDFYCKSYDYELTYKQAKDELDYAMKYLKKIHPSFYEGIPPKIQKQYDAAVLNLEHTDPITVNTVAQQIQGICYLLGDSHTHVTVNYPDERYMKHIYRHREAGDILKGLNGQTWEQMLETDSPSFDKISYEVKEYGIEMLLRYVNSLEGLSYLGISVKDGIVYNYETENGEKSDQYAEEEDFLPYDEYMAYNGIETNDSTEESGFVYYEINEEQKAAILTLDSCIYNDEYKNTVHNMFKEIKEKEIKNIAVDLRNNGGGDSRVANEFLKYIDVDSYKEWAYDWRLGYFMVNIPQKEIKNSKYEDLLFKGNLYLLTSVYTFSSAMNFAEYVKDNHLGTIIGAASGNAPDSYGEISAFKLKNSGLIMQISTKKWYRTDNITGLIEPDILCDEQDALNYFYRECQK